MSDTRPAEQAAVSWAEELDRIEAVLSTFLEQIPEFPAAEPASSAAEALQGILGRLDDGLARLQECLERTGQNARVTEAALQAEAATGQAWAASMAEARQNLAEQIARAV
jgi:hypothetical protein